MLTAYALLVINILSVIACYQIAKHRAGNTRFWGWMGVLFGPFAIPFAFLCKPSDTEPQNENNK
jgi:hypothetical protein